MTLINGHLKEYAIKGAFAILVATAGGGWAFLARIDSRVTELEAINRVTATEMRGIAHDIEEIKVDIRDIPRGEGGLSTNERRNFRQMQEDLACIRGYLAGQSVCPP